MIAETFLQNRFNKGFQKGFEQGFREGFREGFQEGFQEGFREGSLIVKGTRIQQEAWEGWNRRREQAAAEGREFTEPPPTLEIARNGK